MLSHFLEAGLMFYTNNHADSEGYRKKIHGGTGLMGDGYVPHCELDAAAQRRE